MFNNIINRLKIISHNPLYWWFYICCGFMLLSVALFYHHVLGEQPCLICIQVRLLISLLMIVALIAVFFSRIQRLNSMMHVTTVFIAAGMVERSYQLLGTERGFVFSDCGFDLGLPAWFAIQEWLPWLYLVETTCGYTPELIMGITMAEALMVLSVVFVVFSFCVALASFSRFDH